MCLAALNSTRDIPLLNAQLTSSQQAWTKLNEAGQKDVAQGELPSGAQVQLRDVALAALVHLQQIPPQSVGLKLLPSRQLLYRPDTVGSVNDEVRAQRLKQYRAIIAP
ncbi:MAG: hypothetical protein ACKO2P_09075 [Planctomycetota bacterium]